MRKYRILLMLPFLWAACNSHPAEQSNEIVPLPSAQGYDSLKAQKLGADAYGMKQYVTAFLKKGPNRNIDSAQRVQLQRAHLDNIVKLAQEGKLVLAGPFLDNGELRGIYIFNVESIREADSLTSTDPAVKAGSLTMELHPWYGSAALQELNELHRKIAKLNP